MSRADEVIRPSKFFCWKNHRQFQLSWNTILIAQQKYSVRIIYKSVIDYKIELKDGFCYGISWDLLFEDCVGSTPPIGNNGPRNLGCGGSSWEGDPELKYKANIIIFHDSSTIDLLFINRFWKNSLGLFKSGLFRSDFSQSSTYWNHDLLWNWEWLF